MKHNNEKHKIRLSNVSSKRIWVMAITLFVFGFTEHIKAHQVISMIEQSEYASNDLMDQYILVNKSDKNQFVVSMKVQEMPLIDAIKELTFQMKMGLSYSSDLNLDERVSFSAEHLGIFEVLDYFLKDNGFEYRVSDNQNVLVIKKNEVENQKVSAIDSIRGRVLDFQSGEPIPGVNIVIQGTSRGTSTNANGEFELEVDNLDAILIFSYIGYERQVVSISGRENVEVEMRLSVVSVDDVVVVGYGTQLRESVTSSISVIKGEEIQQSQVTTFTEGLTGRLPGVQIIQTTGDPGAPPSIRIRGTGSISAGNEPLYVVDGFPMSGDALSMLNLGDIESISVLKDASATSIYGSRGANGVILVTTRRGVERRPRVTFQTYTGFQSVTKKLDVLSPEEFVEFAIDARNNGWEYVGGNASDPNEDRPPFYRISPYLLDSSLWDRTDWQDEIFQIAPVSDYQLRITGGSETIQYMLSGGYYDQQGLIKNSSFKRYTFRSNLDSQPTEWLKLNGTILTSIVDNKRARDQGQFNAGIVGSAINSPGLYGTRNEDGSYPSQWGFGYGVSVVRNPMAFINEFNDQRDQYRTLANFSGEAELLEGLQLKSMFGIDVNQIRNNSFQNSFDYDLPQNPGHSRGTVAANGSYGSISGFNWLWENTLNYLLEPAQNHRVGMLAGFTAQKERTELSSIRATNFPNNLVPTLNAGQISNANTSRSEWSLLSYFGRVNYDYQQTYYVSATIRTDGSSRFGNNKRWGVFPSASVGWMVSNESFFDILWINFLKLRASYGISGNNEIPNYGSIGLLSFNDYVIGGSLISGLSPSSLTNANLSWERSEQVDLGMDLGLFNDRLNLVVDFYQSVNNDLLLDVSVPSIMGVTNTLQNIGIVRNRGVEISLNSRNLSGGFNWSTDLNFTLNRNEVLALGPEGDPIISRSNQTSHITQIGKPIGSFFGYIFDGVYNSQDEINSRPSLPTDVPGSPIVRDVNGDGEITAADRTIIGSPHPDFTYGMTNRFSYRNIDLSLQIQGVQGVDVMNLGMRQSLSMSGRTNNLGIARERWRSAEEPGNGEIFRANIDIRGVQRQPSTLYMEDGSYLRVRNITIGYTVPAQVLSRIGLSNTRVYLSAQNPFTITNYRGYNPEVSSYHNALTQGVDYFNYPLARTISMGASLTF